MRQILTRHLASGIGTSALIAVLIAVTVFVVALAPRALVRLGTEELRYELSQQPPVRIDLRGTGTIGFGTSTSPSDTAEKYLGPTGDIIDRIPSTLPQPLGDGASIGGWVLRTKTIQAFAPHDPVIGLPLKLAVDLDWLDRIVFTEGQQPAPWDGAAEVDSQQTPAPIEIAISRAAADVLEASPGDIIDGEPADYEIVGIYEAVDEGSTYWQHAPDLLEPTIIREPSAPIKVQASALVNPDTVVGLAETFRFGELSAWVSIDPMAYEYSDLELLGEQVREFAATPTSLANGGQLQFRSAIDEVLEQTGDRVAATSALIALSGSGFLGVLAATYALSIRALVSRRRSALALSSARGASPGQLRGVLVLESALVALPVSLLSIAAAALVLPETIGWAGWLAPGAVALLPVVLAFALAGSGPAPGRTDEVVATRFPRWMLEGIVVVLAAVALFLLQRRGLLESSAAVGIDPLLSATPVLLATLVGLAVLRLYPLPLRAIHRRLVRTRGAAAVVGAARAIRDPAIGLVGTLALVTGISIVVFTAVMITTVESGLRTAVKHEVGADIQVDAHDLPQSLVDDITALPEVADAVALVIASGVEFSDEDGPSEVTVVLADTAALHAVRPDIPDLSVEVDGRLPVLISADWISRVEGTDIRVVNSQGVVVDSVAINALPGVARRWLLVDIAAKSELGLEAETPDRVLVSIAEGSRPADAVKAITTVAEAEQPEGLEQSVRVDDVASLLEERRAAPVVGGLELALVIASLASLVLTMLIIVLSSLTAAAARNRVVGVLRIIGMDARQIRTLIAWETVPVAAVAVVVGAGLGLGLPYLVTAVLDLRGFLGGNTAPQPAIDPVWIAGAIGAFIVAVVLAGSAATIAGRRFAPAGTLKMGDE